MASSLVRSLVQCNKCNTAGHPNQMIGFVKTDKRKADGKVFWDLINEDGSPHVHKTNVMLPDIEDPIKINQPQPNQPLPKTEQKVNPVIDATNGTVADLVYAINTNTLAAMATTEAERNIVKARLARYE